MFHLLKPTPGSTHKRKRVARGNSAGGGTTAGRGTKGQQARAGKGRRFGFEGGQVPLIRRQPKLGGFANPNRIDFEVLNLDVMEANLESGKYDAKSLREKRVLRTSKPVKVLARGKITKKFDLSAHAFSKAARAAITASGGTVTLVKVAR